MNILNKSALAALLTAGMLSLGAVDGFAQQASPSPSPASGPSVAPNVPFSESAVSKLKRIFGTSNPSANALAKYAKSHPNQAGNISVTLGEAGISGATLTRDIQFLGQGILNSGKSASVVNFGLTLLYSSSLNVAAQTAVDSAFSDLDVPPKYQSSVNISNVTGGQVSGAS